MSQTSDPVVLDALQKIQQTQSQLVASIESLAERVGSDGSHPIPTATSSSPLGSLAKSDEADPALEPHEPVGNESYASESRAPALPASNSRTGFTSRIVLT